MRTQNQQQRQHCRHGINCKYLPTNNCRFYHTPQESAMRGRMNYANTPSNQQYQYQQNERRSSSKSKRPPYQQSYQQSYQQPHHQSHHQPHHQPHQPNARQNTSFGRTKEDNLKMVCKGFHLGSCKFMDKCEQLHQFLYKDPQGMRRLEHHRTIPQNTAARLTKIQCQGKQIFALRQGSEVMLFEYSFEGGQLINLGGGISLPGKCEYYQQKDKCFYFSAENETTKYTDMGFHNIQTQEKIWVTNSHTAKITGMVHWDENMLFTSSVAGDIKAWIRSEEGFLFNKEATEELLRKYNPHSTQLEILFLDIITLNEVKILTAGTNDGRLLFWSGNSFQFMEFSLGQRYVKVFKAKLVQLESNLTAAVLAWNAQNTLSAVLLINLQNTNVTVLREVQSADKSKNLHLLECMDEYFFIGCLRGEVSVYNLRESDKKVGAILHQNMVADVICSAVEMKTTGVRVKLVYVLEKRTLESEGSFAIYLLQ